MVSHFSIWMRHRLYLRTFYLYLIVVPFVSLPALSYLRVCTRGVPWGRRGRQGNQPLSVFAKSSFQGCFPKA